jgi:hypothetical protein
MITILIIDIILINIFNIIVNEEKITILLNKSFLFARFNILANKSMMNSILNIITLVWILC